MMHTRKEFHAIGCLAIAVLSMSQLVGCNNAYELRHSTRQEKNQPETQVKAVYQSNQEAVLSVSDSASGERYLNEQDPLSKSVESEAELKTSAGQQKGQIIREYAAHYRVN